jgi:putative ABC transport system permease protein
MAVTGRAQRPSQSSTKLRRAASFRTRIRWGSLALIGLAAGLAAALLATRWLGSLLYGVTAADPATFLAVAALVFGVAMAATLMPARRATGIAPVEALRHE